MAAFFCSACGGEPRPSAQYVDLDGDGFGSADVIVVLAGSPGSSSVSTDCDDTDPSINPAASEDCSAVDRNCDGLLDYGAVDQPLWYEDVDMDGAADSSASSFASCTPPGGGRTTRLGDCAPTDPTRGPLAREIPYNHVDDDCDPSTPDDDLDADGLGFALDCFDSDPTKTSGPGASFVDVADAAGFGNDVRVLPANFLDCPVMVMAGGVAVGDIDGDGRFDVYVMGLSGPGYLHRNRGDGTFENVTLGSGLMAMEAASAAAFADLDADGDADLYVTTAGDEPSRLYINDGTGHFVEEGAARGASATPAMRCGLHFSVTIADVDGDGDLDLHLPSWSDSRDSLAPEGYVLLNDGNAHFSRAPAELGLEFTNRPAFTPHYADFNDDGRRDLAFVADFVESGYRMAFLDPPERVFVEITRLAGAGLDDSGMGSAVGDYDGDGDLDWFVSAIYPSLQECPPFRGDCSGNRLYRNRGNGTFEEVGAAAGVLDGGWGWGASFFDYDNDGDLDLGHNNGFDWNHTPDDRIRLFESSGDGTFAERACELGVATTDDGRTFVPFDFDDDGDLDILATGHFASVHLYRNDVGTQHAWLKVRLRDPLGINTAGIGASVYVRATPAALWVRREIDANSTYGAVGPAEAHFGLGAASGLLDEVRVVWPDGAEQRINSVALRQTLVVTRGP